MHNATSPGNCKLDGGSQRPRFQVLTDFLCRIDDAYLWKTCECVYYTCESRVSCLVKNRCLFTAKITLYPSPYIEKTLPRDRRVHMDTLTQLMGFSLDFRFSFYIFFFFTSFSVLLLLCLSFFLEILLLNYQLTKMTIFLLLIGG